MSIGTSGDHTKGDGSSVVFVFRSCPTRRCGGNLVRRGHDEHRKLQNLFRKECAMEPKTPIPSSYSILEVRTRNGGVATLGIRSEHAEEIATLIAEHVVSIRLPANEGHVGKGSYRKYSRYHIEQHRYAGGGCPNNGGYIEALEIHDAPEGRHPFIIYASSERPLDPPRGLFAEFHTLQETIAAYEQLWGKSRGSITKTAPTLPGFQRLVQCDYLTPWFYAVGNQELLGDFVVIPGWGNDPLYRVGAWYLVTTERECTRVKVCMGALVTSTSLSDNHDMDVRHYVLWHDGTHWNGTGTPPRLCKHQPETLALPPDRS